MRVNRGYRKFAEQISDNHIYPLNLNRIPKIVYHAQRKNFVSKFGFRRRLLKISGVFFQESSSYPLKMLNLFFVN